MSEATLVIGNKNYSSWSLRGWLMARKAGLDFDEILIPLGRPDTRARILEHSPSGRVPCLSHGSMRVWETLSIGEYLAELFPFASLWPEDRLARSHARSVSAEMHAGFATLRTSMPMNVRAALPGKGRDRGNRDLLERDINRIRDLWREARDRYGRKHLADQGYLYGHFTIADAMYAPVVFRFNTYDIELDGACRAYVDVMLRNNLMREWADAAAREPLDMPDKNL